MVTAADGSTWYQVATGEGSAAFYDVPEFSGSALEESQVRETFPGVDEGTTLRTVEQGVVRFSFSHTNTRRRRLPLPVRCAAWRRNK